MYPLCSHKYFKLRVWLWDIPAPDNYILSVTLGKISFVTT